MITSTLKRAKKRLTEYSRWHLERHVLKALTKPRYVVALDHTADWEIPKDRLYRGAVCYCAGVGEDIGLELHLIARYGASVFAFDPTPRAKVYLESINYDMDKLRYYEYGLWSKNEVLKFYAPDNPAHVSHSVVQNGNHGKSYFEAPCKTLASIMAELGHRRVELLKMNIEGAEYEVLGNLIEERLRPSVIMLTFEGKGALQKGVEWTYKMRGYGYELVGLNKWVATFVDLS